MKKLPLIVLAILILTCSLGYASATVRTVEKDPVESLTPQQKVRLQIITLRVKEIKSIDKSELNRDEKKSLRTELKQLKKEARGMAAGGVFLTVGSLLAVIVLLVVLL